MDKPLPRYYPYLWLPVFVIAAYFFGGPVLMIPGGIMFYELIKPDAGILRRFQRIHRLTPILRIVLIVAVLVMLKFLIILPLFFGGGM